MRIEEQILKKKKHQEQLLIFKAGPQMHQSNSQKPATRGPSMSAIWNNSSIANPGKARGCSANTFVTD